jgi:hypothetical protein
MRSLLARRPSPAMIVALVALVLATSGTGYAVQRASVKATSVDGLSAVRSTASLRRAAGRLVATERRGANRGRFNARFIPKVGRARRADRATAADRATLAARADAATTAATATNATTVGGRSATQLTAACPAGTVDAGSLCFESAARPPAQPLVAFRTCVQAGGVVPQAADLLGASQAGRLTLAAEEWSGTIVGTGATAYLTVNAFGPASTFGPANTQPFRCAFAPREPR